MKIKKILKALSKLNQDDLDFILRHNTCEYCDSFKYCSATLTTDYEYLCVACEKLLCEEAG